MKNAHVESYLDLLPASRTSCFGPYDHFLESLKKRPSTIILKKVARLNEGYVDFPNKKFITISIFITISQAQPNIDGLNRMEIYIPTGTLDPLLTFEDYEKQLVEMGFEIEDHRLSQLIDKEYLADLSSGQHLRKLDLICKSVEKSFKKKY